MTKKFKGIKYTVTDLYGCDCYSGYDNLGIRIIFAMSKKEFEKKVNKFVKDGTNDFKEDYNGIRKLIRNKRRSI